MQCLSRIGEDSHVDQACEHQVTVPLDRELWEFVEREAARDDRSLAGRGTFAPMAAGTWTMPSQRGHECRLATRRNTGAITLPADGLHKVRNDRRRRPA
jgi:hypothetical protein